MRSIRSAMRCGSAIVSGLLFCGTAFAQNAPADDQAIVVTGRGLDAAPGDSVYDSVVIPRDRLTDSASDRLENILPDVAGFQNFRRSDAGSANPTSQGATLRGLGGNASSRALLVLDGVPQSDPFGGWVFWPAYDPRRLAEARVVRGGGTGADGPGALAGTIELSSVGPADLNGLTADLAYGSRDSVDAFGAVGAKLGQGYAALSGSFARSDGFVPVIAAQRGPVDRPSPYQQASIALRTIVPVSDTVELQSNESWFSDRRQRGTAFSDIDTTGENASLRLVGRGDWGWSALAYLQVRQFYNSFAGVDATRSIVMRTSEQYNVPSTGTGAQVEVRPALGGGFTLRLGADTRRTEGETRELFSFLNNVGRNRRAAGGSNQTLGAYAEGAWEQGQVTLTAGGRIDRWWIDDGHLYESVLATGAILNDLHFPDRSGWLPTGRAGAAWRAIDGLTLRTAAYLGWRMPTLNELYRPFRVGADVTNANAALVPERMKGAEAGVDYRPIPALRFGLTLFANRLEDAIANVTISSGPGGTVSQRRNVDAIAAQGVELESELSLGALRISASYSHVDARVYAPGAALDGNRPAQTPRDTVSAIAAWHPAGGLSASVTARYVGDQYEDDLQSQSLKGALTFDATLAVPIAKRWSIEVRGENLTNALVMAGISSAGIVEQATPRTLWIGLRLR